MYPGSLASEFVYPTIYSTYPVASTQLADGPYPMQAIGSRHPESQVGYNIGLKSLRIPEKTCSLELCQPISYPWARDNIKWADLEPNYDSFEEFQKHRSSTSRRR